jgi:hypothetical protein
MLMDSGFLQACMTPPTVETLLALKDDLHIPDDWWHQVVGTFKLGAEASLHHIEKARHRFNNILLISPTPVGVGYEVVSGLCFGGGVCFRC